jgi:pre-rRNA-processing protein TSR3
MKRAVLLRDMRQIPKRAVVLNPVAEVALSPSDADTVKRAGIVALDCSWNQAEEIFKEAKEKFLASKNAPPMPGGPPKTGT